MEALHELFDDTYDEVMALPDTPHAGLAYWRKQKLFFSSIPLTNLEWVNVDESFDPHNTLNEFYIDPIMHLVFYGTGASTIEEITKYLKLKRQHAEFSKYVTRITDSIIELN